MPASIHPSYYVKLLQFCDDNLIRVAPVQRECVEAAGKHIGHQAAADSIGKDKRHFSKSVKKVEQKAVAHGFTPNLPQHGLTVPGFETTKLSTYTAKDGETAGWHIQEREKFATKLLFEAFCEEMSEGLPQPALDQFPELQTTEELSESLLSMVTVGDGHFGMYAWGEETGHEDFNAHIASADLRAAGEILIRKAPPAKTLVIANVGDFLHMNDSMNRTFKGTMVDVDTRMSRVLEIAALSLRHLVDEGLKKFEQVILINVRGNHDTDIAVGMNMALRFFYENNPRVVVPQNKGFFHWMEWGEWLWGFTHGDKAKHGKLGDVMAREMRESWGRTYHHMWITGHFHNDTILTLPNGCKVKVCNPLVPPDGWHASMGYGGEQSMELTTYKKEGGVHSSFVHHIIRPKQIINEVLQVA